ncbi:hypothetical protein VNI00_004503 [Paramarasmius palmivorus]|uniref:Aminoglycoside phosphotransferase domain-containing protein n=1 Tax=Paramarasmius palmivorus TaxID=297713 RepID=A0AAW0DI71_9AGAR
MLKPGMTFSLNLQHPRLPEPREHLRCLPSLPYNELAEYFIVTGVQAGDDFNSQVWLGKPNDAVALVFKFMAPSSLDHLLRDDIEGIDRSVEDMIECQEAMFTGLWDLQGTALPWFFGIHKVLLSNELAYLLITEYIPHAFESIPRFSPVDVGQYIEYVSAFNDAFISKVNQTSDFEKFKTAVQALDLAHSRQIYHLDISKSNLRFDTSQVVLIDWMNDISHHKRIKITDPSLIAIIDFRDLVMTFARGENGIGKEFFLKMMTDASEIGQRVKALFCQRPA